MERVLVTIDEAAIALGVGRSTIYKLMGNGDLGAAKIGRRSLITAESVRVYAAKVSQADQVKGGGN